jgi:VWFA-related protein
MRLEKSTFRQSIAIMAIMVIMVIMAIMAILPILARSVQALSDRTWLQTGQSAPQKQKQEGFGSSLERLKWDARSHRAVEKTPRSEPGADDVVRLSTLLVVVNASVTDNTSRPVSGLTRDDFSLLEDGHPQEVSVFAQGDHDSIRRKVILIIDRSGSERAYLDSSLDAAKKLVEDLLPSDQMAIATDDVELAVGYTADKAALKDTLDRLGSRSRRVGRSGASGSKTAVFHSRSLQFTALFAAIRELVKDDGSRYIIIFQTDGDEAPTLRDQPDAGDYLWNMPKRNYGLADIYAAVQRSNGMIYTIIPSERLTGLEPAELLERGRAMLERMERVRFRSDRDFETYMTTHPLSDAKVRLFTERFAAGQCAAQRVAELTGGWASYLERPEQAAAIYSRILSDMNHRYVIGYYPSDHSQDSRRSGAQGAGLRHLKITVKTHPEYIVLGRDSYLPPH